MSADVVLLVATAALAVVAVVAAAVAVTAVRRLARYQATPAAPVTGEDRQVESIDSVDAVRTPEPARTAPEPAATDSLVPAPLDQSDPALAPRVVHGRVVVPPSSDQVVAAAMSRPQVRLSILAHGVAHALRPESRDRIAALMRREYRGRRRARLAAGRRAARSAHPTPAADRWLGES